jgi:uroporphyrinogen decarboxylase
VAFWETAGYDYIPLTVGMMRPGGVTRDSHISKVIGEMASEREEEEAWNIWKKPRIFDEEGLEAFPWEQAFEFDFSKFWEVQDLLPPKMKIIAVSGKIFTLTWMMMGFENFATSLRTNPGFVDAVLGKVAEIQLAGIRQVVEIPNVAAAWAVDDIAFGSGPLVDPEFFRRSLFPWYEEMSRLCKAHGLFLFFHSDGVLWEFFDDLIALGIDAVHPIDPTCMEIEEVQERVGDRICLLGNVSNELLAEGTPQDIEEVTRRRLKRLAPGGGYCLGSGNSVPSWARLENYQAMIATCLREGRYPIQVE